MLFIMYYSFTVVATKFSQSAYLGTMAGLPRRRPYDVIRDYSGGHTQLRRTSPNNNVATFDTASITTVQYGLEDCLT
jgi:hypothetical protein